MGQKINPISNRIGIIRGWDSNWYGGDDYAAKLLEDSKIREYLTPRYVSTSMPVSPRSTSPRSSSRGLSSSSQ